MRHPDDEPEPELDDFDTEEEFEREWCQWRRYNKQAADRIMNHWDMEPAAWLID
jgi:hypothetical protein